MNLKKDNQIKTLSQLNFIIKHTIETKDIKWFIFIDPAKCKKDIFFIHDEHNHPIGFVFPHNIEPYYKKYAALIKEIYKNNGDMKNVINEYIKYIGILNDDLELFGDGVFLEFIYNEDFLLNILSDLRPKKILNYLIGKIELPLDVRIEFEHIIASMSKKESIKYTNKYVDKTLYIIDQLKKSFI